MKNRFKFFGFIFIVIINFVFSLFSEPIYQANAAEWYDASWNYRKEITLTPATTVANYQVKIELTAANFDYTKAKANGEDLRFTASDGTTLQDYWIETWVSGGTSIIWVKVANSGTSNIYMYYGNVAVANMSTSNIFEFFDSFDDGDVSDWTAATYYQTISSSSSIDSSYLASPEYSFKMYAKANCWNAPYSGAEIRMSKTIALPNGNYIADFYQKFIGTRDRACAWGNTSNYLYFYINNTIRFTRNCSGACTAIITCDTQSSTSDFFQITTGSAKISLSARPTDCSYSTSWFDDVRIRKYASPEPVANIGSESSLPPPPSACDSFTATPASITLGNSSNLTWATTNATSVDIDNGVISTDLDGSEIVFPALTTIYTLTATNASGDSTTCSTSVTVNTGAGGGTGAGGHMELHYFDKDIVKVFNDASKILLSFAGRLVLLFLIFGGVYYIISGSDPQKQEIAKKIIECTLIGGILVLLSLGVISTVEDVSIAPCGNGIIDTGETCDTYGNLGCTVPNIMCSAGCNSCEAPPCGPADGVCPAGCSNPPDSDCAAVCGDGEIGTSEICDTFGDVGCTASICRADCSECIPNYTISGHVQNTTTASPIAGASIELFDNSNNLIQSTTTDASGDYTFNASSEINYYILISSSGFTSGDSGIFLLDTDVIKDFSLSEIFLGGSKIVLSWGNSCDLDAHLTFGATHIYYNNLSQNGAILTSDGPSPEIITINALVPGVTYTYFAVAYNCANTNTAVARVYNSAGSLVKEYTNSGPSPWRVFTIDGSTGLITDF